MAPSLSRSTCDDDNAPKKRKKKGDVENVQERLHVLHSSALHSKYGGFVSALQEKLCDEAIPSVSLLRAI